MRFNHKRKTYPAVKIGDVYYVRDEDFLKSELYKEYQKLKTEIKHKNQLWKTAFKKYKNFKKIIAALVGLGSSKPKVNQNKEALNGLQGY